MKYFIFKQGKSQGPFSIEELRNDNTITEETRVKPYIKDNDGEEQPYKPASKFDELAQLFTKPELSNPITTVPPNNQKEADELRTKPDFSNGENIDIVITPTPPIDTNIVITPIPPIDTGILITPTPPKVKTIWVYTIVGLVVILSVTYWLIRPPLPPIKTDCKAKSDSLLRIGEQNIEQPNGESLIAFSLMKDYKDCADKEKIDSLKAKFNSNITTDKAIINDPDIQKRNTQFKEAIKLLNEINTPN